MNTATNPENCIVRISREAVEHLSDTNRSVVENIVSGIAGMCVQEKRLRKITMTISGYDNDPRELYEIPEVCAWARETNKIMSGLWFFLDEDSQYRFVGWLCGPASLNGIQSSEFQKRFDAQKMECAVKSTAASADVLEKAGASKSLISQFYFQDMYKRAAGPGEPAKDTAAKDQAPSAQNNDEKIIILCENCNQKLRLPIPAPRKKLRVTCPKCRHEFMFKYDPNNLRHYEHEHLRMAIVHQDSNLTKHETPLIGPYRKTYAYWRSDPFYWELTRPKTSDEKFSFTCPHCGKKLEMDLQSLESLAKGRVNSRKTKKIVWPIALIITLFSIGIMIIDSRMPELLGNWEYLALLIFPGALTLLYSIFGNVINPLGGFTNIEMKMIEPTLSGHYFAYIESH
jgi:DNA-directed RNA polymerase subunit RPC12/RpoP